MSTKRETLLSEEDVMFPKDFGPALSPLDVREIYEAARAKDAAAIAHMEHCRAMLGAADDETLADAIERVRANDAEDIAKWKGIVKGVHGALTDIGTVPVPAMDADLYDAVMSIRAKDAELIQRLVDAGNAMSDAISWHINEHVWENRIPYGTEVDMNKAAEEWDTLAAGFTPTNS